MPLGWAMTLIDVGAKRLVSSPVDFLLDFFARCVISFFLFGSIFNPPMYKIIMT